MPKRLPPVHPGEVLLEDFLKPLGLSQYRLAKGLSVPPRRINEQSIRTVLRALVCLDEGQHVQVAFCSVYGRPTSGVTSSSRI